MVANSNRVQVVLLVMVVSSAFEATNGLMSEIASQSASNIEGDLIIRDKRQTLSTEDADFCVGKCMAAMGASLIPINDAANVTDPVPWMPGPNRQYIEQKCRSLQNLLNCTQQCGEYSQLQRIIVDGALVSLPICNFTNKDVDSYMDCMNKIASTMETFMNGYQSVNGTIGNVESAKIQYLLLNSNDIDSMASSIGAKYRDMGNKVDELVKKECPGNLLAIQVSTEYNKQIVAYLETLRKQSQYLAVTSNGRQSSMSFALLHVITLWYIFANQ